MCIIAYPFCDQNVIIRLSEYSAYTSTQPLDAIFADVFGVTDALYGDSVYLLDRLAGP